MRRLRSVLVSIAFGALFWALILAAVMAASAQQIRRDADVWCIQHHPCDWSAHTAFTWGGANVSAGVLSALLPGRVSPRLTRWGMAAYYVQREVRQLKRWGLTTKDASKIAAMPLWLDSIFDMGFMVFGLWLAPKPFDRSRVRMVAGPGMVGIQVETR